MSTISVTAKEIALVRPTQAETWNVKLAAAVTQGQVLYQTSSGTFGLCEADKSAKDEPRGVALEEGSSGQVISMVKRGAIYGADLSGESYDALVYASSTGGGLSDSSKAEVIGRVITLTDPDKTKVLYVECPWGDSNFN